MAQKNKKRNSWSGMNTITSCISTTLMLVLLGFVMFFISFAHNFSSHLRENFTVSILLDDDITPEETSAFNQELKQMPATRLVTYISKEKALKEQIEALNSDPSEFMGTNPMPASFEMHLKAEYANKDSLDLLLPVLEKHDKIIEVSYPQSLLESLNSNIQKISGVLLFIALLLTMVSFVLINNTIQLSVFSQRFLIHTMKLVGANWSFIRKPFIIQALRIGLLSAVLATILLICIIYGMIQFEPQMDELITWKVIMNAISVIFICGILLTTGCAYTTVNKTLKLKNNKLYRY